MVLIEKSIKVSRSDYAFVLTKEHDGSVTIAYEEDGDQKKYVFIDSESLPHVVEGLKELTR